MEAETETAHPSVSTCASVISRSHFDVCDVSSTEAEEATEVEGTESVSVTVEHTLVLLSPLSWFTLECKYASVSVPIYAYAGFLNFICIRKKGKLYRKGGYIRNVLHEQIYVGVSCIYHCHILNPNSLFPTSSPNIPTLVHVHPHLSSITITRRPSDFVATKCLLSCLRR